MKRAVLKKIYRIGAGWLLMLLVLCSLANSFSIQSYADTGRTAWTAAGRSGRAADDGGAGGIAGSGWMRSASVSNVDVVIVTVASIEGKTATEYADDYFDYQGYGYGEKSDGILLLVGMKERVWAISTHGSLGISAFTDAGLDYIKEDVQFQLKLDNLCKGISNLCESL